MDYLCCGFMDGDRCPVWWGHRVAHSPESGTVACYRRRMCFSRYGALASMVNWSVALFRSGMDNIFIYIWLLFGYLGRNCLGKTLSRAVHESFCRRGAICSHSVGRFAALRMEWLVRRWCSRPLVRRSQQKPTIRRAWTAQSVGYFPIVGTYCQLLFLRQENNRRARRACGCRILVVRAGTDSIAYGHIVRCMPLGLDLLPSQYVGEKISGSCSNRPVNLFSDLPLHTGESW